jgi:hypothetical protein
MEEDFCIDCLFEEKNVDSKEERNLKNRIYMKEYYYKKGKEMKRKKYFQKTEKKKIQKYSSFLEELGFLIIPPE